MTSAVGYVRADLSCIKSQLDPSVLSALNYTLEPDEGPTTELRAKESVNLAKSIPTLVLKGERHTGTHWLSHVLKHNFAPEQQRLHVAQKPDDPQARPGMGGQRALAGGGRGLDLGRAAFFHAKFPSCGSRV